MGRGINDVAGSTGVKVTEGDLALRDGRNGVYWTAYRGRVYDVTNWISKHPGGDVVRLCCGREGTILIEGYHPAGRATERVDLMLAKYGEVVGDYVDSKVHQDASFFHAVRANVAAHLDKRGISVHAYDNTLLLEAFVTILLFIAAAAYKTWHCSALAGIAWGLMQGRLGFLMHTGNHCATGRHWSNVLMSYLMDVAGSNHIIWRWEHQVAHHQHVNELHKDNDCEIANPLLRFHPQLPHHVWQRLNHVVTIVGMTFGTLKWMVSDFFVFAAHRVGNVEFSPSTFDWAVFLIFKSIHIGWHIVIPVYWFGLAGVWPYVLGQFVAAHYMEEIFIVNHIQEGLVPDGARHWAEKQVLGTANWASGSHVMNFVSGGLNHQIEHHLFPAMNIYLYPEISDVVRKTCEEYKLPYHNFTTYGEAWCAMFTTLKHYGENASSPSKKAA